LSFFLFTSFLLTIPIIGQYETTFRFITGIISHTGIYGQGTSGAFDINWFLARLLKVVQINSSVFFVMFIAVLFIFYNVWNMCKYRDADQEKNKEATKYILVLVGICIIQWLIVAKHPAPQYFVPALGLCGLLAAFIYRLIWEKNSSKLVVSLLLIIFVCFHSFKAFRYYKDVVNTAKATFSFSNMVHNDYNACAIFHYYRSSSRLYALMLGDSFKEIFLYTSELKKRFKNIYHYDQSEQTYFNFDKVVKLNEVKKVNACAVLYGTNYQKTLPLEVIKSMPVEILYRL